MKNTGAGIHRPETQEERDAVVRDKIANDDRYGYNTQRDVLSACYVPRRTLQVKKDRKGNVVRRYYDPVPADKVCYLDDEDQHPNKEKSRKIRVKSTYLAWQCFWESLALKDAAK